MMFDHIGFNVSDFSSSKDFFVKALQPLNISICAEGPGWAMFGRPGKGQFWVGAFGNSPGPVHIAFAAATREEVQQFYAAALAAGAQDNGAPGLRPQYHPHYFAAFVIGPDGHNLEAVCHAAQS